MQVVNAMTSWFVTFSISSMRSTVKSACARIHAASSFVMPDLPSSPAPRRPAPRSPSKWRTCSQAPRCDPFPDECSDRSCAFPFPGSLRGRLSGLRVFLREQGTRNSPLRRRLSPKRSIPARRDAAASPAHVGLCANQQDSLSNEEYFRCRNRSARVRCIVTRRSDREAEGARLLSEYAHKGI